MDEVGGQEVEERAESMRGYCFDCRHELIDVGKSACPECGRWFDPENPRTFYRRRPGRFVCYAMNPAGWPSVLFALVLAFLVLAAFSVPDGYLFLSILVVVIGVPITGLLLICDVIFSMALSRWTGRPWFKEVRPYPERPRWRKSQLKWLVAPIFVGAAFLLVALDIPSRFTFWYSSDALRGLAERQKSGGSLAPTFVGEYVGLIPVTFVEYPVSTVGGLDASVVWIDSGFIDTVGFAYLPEALDDSIELTDGGGGWRYSDDWFLVRVGF